jgi:hypothetical protein
MLDHSTAIMSRTGRHDPKGITGRELITPSERNKLIALGRDCARARKPANSAPFWRAAGNLLITPSGW